MSLFRKLLEMPVHCDMEKDSELHELASEILLGNYNMSQKKVALRKIDQSTGVEETIVTEEMVKAYIAMAS